MCINWVLVSASDFFRLPDKIPQQYVCKVGLGSQDLSRRLDRVENIHLGLGLTQHYNKYVPIKFEHFSKHTLNICLFILDRLYDNFEKFLDPN